MYNNQEIISKFIKESGVDLSNKIINFERPSINEYRAIEEPFSIKHISDPIHVPWLYKNGQKIGFSDVNIRWDDSIVDMIIKSEKYKELIETKTYMIQQYPGDFVGFIGHVTTDTIKIALILNVAYDGVTLQLNPRGNNIITDSMRDNLFAYPSMLRVNDKVGYIGNIYLIYKTEDGEYKYV